MKRMAVDAKQSKQKRKSDAESSANFVSERIEWLKSIFPEVVSEHKVDFEKLRLMLGDQVDELSERYGLSWAGKRDSQFLLRIPPAGTLIPNKKESANFNETKNLFIEGENLEALKLLYKSYFGRVKLIYIDPPYNTGNDFIYSDNYADPLDMYLRLTKQKDANGNLLTSNPETGGRYHSAWLSMMYPRLFLARQLLSDDGVIWISIDDAEAANLRPICNEIFGEENFVANFIWQKRTTRENRRVFSFNHDYILCYAKDKDLFQSSRKLLPLSEEVLKRYSNPDKDPRGNWQSVSLNAQAGHGTPDQFYTLTTPGGRKVSSPSGRCWSVTKRRMQELIVDKRVWFGRDGKNIPRLKVFRSEANEGLTPHTLWTADEVGTNDSAKKALIQLFSGKAVYETPKPVELMKRIIHISTSGNDLILDFFAGTCTTAHATLELNREDGGQRQFIMVQLPEPTPNGSEAYKAGYRTISAIGIERIKRVLKRMIAKKTKGKKSVPSKGKEDLGCKVFRLAESNFRSWTGVEDKNPSTYAKTMELFSDPLLPQSKHEDVIWEVALREGFTPNSSIEIASKVNGNTIYNVRDQEKDLIFKICLDNSLKKSTLSTLKFTSEDHFICRDKAINDEVAANLALQCGRFETI